MIAKKSFSALLPLAIAIGFASTALAGVRLTYPVMGTPKSVYWASDSFPIHYEVEQRLTAASADAPAMFDRAFAAWTSLEEANITFQQTPFVAGDRAGKNGRNSVTVADDLFQNQGMLAVTTNWYDDDGKLTEADIQVDATLMTSSYNAQLALEHEIGHLLGLDHSAVLSAVMYPYVGTGPGAAIDSDDRIAIAAVYPKADVSPAGATLKGSVVGSSGAIFAAQVVAVNANGEPVATGLTDQSGQFELRGVPAGDYRLYAEPLDGPVDPNNLAGIWRLAKSDSFPTEFLNGPPIHVESGRIYGNLALNDSGAPVRLNPKWIAVGMPGQPISGLSSMTVTARSGQTVSVAVGGDGFTSGMTTFEVMTPGVVRVSDFHYAGNYASADFNITSQTSGGSAIILVHSGNETATLTGALRIDAASQRARAVRR
ncbi:MAG: matrixin family metalloprotease [Thermoanaerobaculia bacterium]